VPAKLLKFSVKVVPGVMIVWTVWPVPMEVRSSSEQVIA
jgi:hypothetical protein